MVAAGEASGTNGRTVRQVGHDRVARGGSRVTVARCRHPKARRFASPDCDSAFVGFRSCAL